MGTHSLHRKKKQELRPSQTPRTSRVLRSSHTFPSSLLGRASLRMIQQLFVCVQPEISQAPLTTVDMLLLLLITKYKQVSTRTRIDGGTAYGLAKSGRGNGCLVAGLHSAAGVSPRLHPRRGTDLGRLYSFSRGEKQRNGQESDCPLRTPQVSRMSDFCTLIHRFPSPTLSKEKQNISRTYLLSCQSILKSMIQASQDYPFFVDEAT